MRFTPAALRKVIYVVAVSAAVYALFSLSLAHTRAEVAENAPAESTAPLSVATTFTVNSLGDAVDTNTADNLCDSDAALNEQCTLRAAIEQANFSAGDDTINFDATVFAAPGPHTIQLTGPLPSLSSDMSINGPGARILSVRRDTGGDYRIFDVTSGVTVNISAMTITNGRLSGFSNPVDAGGGIRNIGGTLTLDGVNITGNVANLGGGIYSRTDATLSTSSALNIKNSTISANDSANYGGGIANENVNTIRTASLVLINSTISGNTAFNHVGGGIFNRSVGGGQAPVSISSSTISSNHADAAGTGGGGIYSDGSFGGTTNLAFSSSIVADNTAPTRPDIFLDTGANTVSGSYTLVEQAGFTFSSGSLNIIGQDPQLGPLDNNGGPTQTHALLPGSPAIDKGNSFGLTTDQRGLPRPFDNPSIVPASNVAFTGDNSDIGAYEVNGVLQTDSPSFVVNSTADTNDGACTAEAGGCTLREAINAANALVGDNTISFSVTGTINLTSELPDLSANITISGPGANLLGISRDSGAATRFRIFKVTLGATANISRLTVTGGHTSDGGPGGKGVEGGGILNSGTLSLTGVAVVANQSGNGGFGSSFPASGGSGGGIINDGTLTIANSTVSGNLTGKGGFSPGGIFGNTGKGGSGGGIKNTGTLTIINSTISGNQTDANGDGGGIDNTGTLTISNTTISGNAANAGNGGGTRIGGGVVKLRSTIVAGNSADFGPDIWGTVQSDGYNLVGNTANNSGFDLTGANGDQTGVSPNLGPLADNGGYTQTHALLLGSPAIDKGKSFGLTTDQRGQNRTFDNPSIPPATGGDDSDIGAVEVNYAISATAGTPQTANTNAAFGIQLQATVAESGVKQSGILVTFTAAASGASGTFPGNATTATVTTDSNGVATAPVFTANANGGTYSVTASIGSGLSTAGFSLTNNTPPIAGNQSVTADEDTARNIALTGLDANDDNLTFTITQQPGHGTLSVVSTYDCTPVNNCTASVTYTPTPDYNGSDSFAFKVNDGRIESATSGAASITVNEVNDAPAVVSETLTNVAEDSGQRTIPFAALTANDSKGPANESGQTLIVKTVNNPLGGTVSILAGTVLFTPTANYNGPASFDYTVEDNGTTNGVADPQTSGTATASFTITEVNEAPTSVNDLLSNVAEDSGQRTIPFTDLIGNDLKGPADESAQTLIVKTVSNPVGGTVSISGNNVVFTPAADYNGPASFQYSVEDSGTTVGVADPKTSGTAPVSFVITEVNDLPVAVDDGLSSVAEDSGVRMIPLFTLIANDSKGPANESGQTLIVKSVSNPVGGTVSISGSNVLFTPSADYNGAASFQYTVEDNGTTNGAADPKTSAAATASFTVTEINDEPIAVDDTLTSIAEDSAPRAIPFADLTGNDSRGAASESGQTLTVASANNAVGGSLILVPGFVVFTPTANYNGPASFNYTVEDNGTTNGVADPKSSESGAVQFNITEVNDAPTAVNDTLGSVTENSGERSIPFADLTGNDIKGPADESGQSLIVKTVSNPVGVTVSIAEGTVRITPLPDYHGPASFQYTLRDNGTTNGFANEKLSAAATVSFHINGLGGSDSVIRFSSANYSVAESAGFRTITVERTGDTSQAVTVDYSSSDHSNPADLLPCNSPGAGFASSRCDFSTAVGTLRFAAGETSKTFNVLISQDNDVEGAETLQLILSNPVGGMEFGAPATAILEITDDAPEPATNPVDTSSEFVRSQYHDFLKREPDAAGLAFWTDNIEKCNDAARRPASQTAAQCLDKQRESTAVAFFSSPEFQMIGGFVYHLYKGSLTGSPNYDGGSPGRFPTSLEFMRDVSQVSEGIVVNNQLSGAVVEANRNRLAAEFVERPEFVAKYGGLNHTLYVEELFNTTGIAATAGEKQMLVDGLTNGTETRASVLQKVVDGTVVISEGNVQFTTSYGQAFNEQELKRVFVYMEYVGYLRRNPDAAGFVFWLGKLSQYHGDPFQAEMVRSFILAPEYRNRFGQQ